MAHTFFQSIGKQFEESPGRARNALTVDQISQGCNQRQWRLQLNAIAYKGGWRPLDWGTGSGQSIYTPDVVYRILIEETGSVYRPMGDPGGPQTAVIIRDTSIVHRLMGDLYRKERWNNIDGLVSWWQKSDTGVITQWAHPNPTPLGEIYDMHPVPWHYTKQEKTEWRYEPDAGPIPSGDPEYDFWATNTYQRTYFGDKTESVSACITEAVGLVMAMPEDGPVTVYTDPATWDTAAYNLDFGAANPPPSGELYCQYRRTPEGVRACVQTFLVDGEGQPVPPVEATGNFLRAGVSAYGVAERRVGTASKFVVALAEPTCCEVQIQHQRTGAGGLEDWTSFDTYDDIAKNGFYTDRVTRCDTPSWAAMAYADLPPCRDAEPYPCVTIVTKYPSHATNTYGVVEMLCDNCASCIGPFEDSDVASVDCPAEGTP